MQRNLKICKALDVLADLTPTRNGVEGLWLWKFSCRLNTHRSSDERAGIWGRKFRVAGNVDFECFLASGIVKLELVNSEGAHIA